MRASRLTSVYLSQLGTSNIADVASAAKAADVTNANNTNNASNTDDVNNTRNTALEILLRTRTSTAVENFRANLSNKKMAKMLNHMTRYGTSTWDVTDLWVYIGMIDMLPPLIFC